MEVTRTSEGVVANSTECFNLRFDVFGRLSKTNVGNSNSGPGFSKIRTVVETVSSCCENRVKQIAFLHFYNLR